MIVGLVIAKCAKFNECSDWPMLGINQCTHDDLRSNGKMKMINIPFNFNIANSPFGGAYWSCMLFSNNSSACGRPKNLANIVDLLNFLVCPLMNLIGNEVL
jgi:hypothetical protein